MFDRISISFRKSYGPTEVCESVTLFSRHLGTELIAQVCAYLEKLRSQHLLAKGEVTSPLGQLDPHIVMVDFIRWFTKDWDRVRDNLFLGKQEEDGDNSENGHVIFDLDAWQFTRLKIGSVHSISLDSCATKSDGPGATLGLRS
jgi:hypothetical protein